MWTLERETAQSREENEGLQQKLWESKEQFAEQEGRLRVAKMNLETAQKQNMHQMAEVGVGYQLMLCVEVVVGAPDCSSRDSGSIPPLPL